MDDLLLGPSVSLLGMHLTFTERATLNQLEWSIKKEVGLTLCNPEHHATNLRTMACVSHGAGAREFPQAISSQPIKDEVRFPPFYSQLVNPVSLLFRKRTPMAGLNL